MQGAELGSPRIDKGLGSPRRITQLKVGLRQLTGKRQKRHKKRKGGGGGKCPSRAPEAARKVGSVK